MPKVLRIINRFNLGGPTFNAAYLTKYMAPEFETLLIGGEKEPDEESSLHITEKLGLEPVVIPELKRPVNWAQDRKAYRKIIDLIRDFQPDIVHTHASKAGAIGRLAAAKCNVPVVVHTFHGNVFQSYFGPLKSSVFINIERYLARKADRIIAISPIQKRELSEQFRICSPKKITTIPLGFDLDRFQENTVDKRQAFRKLYQIEDDEVAIGIIGRLAVVKNHGLFLDALALCKAQTSKKIRAFIIGDGEEREHIVNHAKALQIPFTLLPEQEVQLLSFTSWIKDVDRAIAGLDMVALTSLNEGTPVSLIEAQAGNKVIVSTDVGGIKDVTLPGQTCFLSPSGAIEPFAKHLLQLIEDDELRTRSGNLGWDFVRSKFHYSRLAEDTKNLYLDLLNEKREL